MKKIKELMPEAYDFNGKLSLKQAIPLGLQHVMAMFVGNLTPLLIIQEPVVLEQEVSMHLFRLHFYRML